MSDEADLRDLADRAVAEAASAVDASALEAVRVRYLGRKEGELTRVLRGLTSLPAERRPASGAAANAAKERIERALADRGAALQAAALDRDLAGEPVDLSLPHRPIRLGRLHPISRTIRELSRIFATLGFESVEGPEVELDYYNFEALNIPKGHPARDKWSTLWIADESAAAVARSRVAGGGTRAEAAGPPQELLLRTHTSPMQVRVMERRRPPIRVIVPGRCYRFEATDAIRESIFFQYEGLAIDEKLTMADLKGVLYAFARQMFGGERRVKFRPDYFPFTEPSAEISFDCFACEGRDTTCRTCGGSGWIEAAGCGMVHPDVLRRVGYDPQRYQGFAFGGGVERLAMLKTGTPDIRLFYQNDLRFLESF